LVSVLAKNIKGFCWKGLRFYRWKWRKDKFRLSYGTSFKIPHRDLPGRFDSLKVMPLVRPRLVFDAFYCLKFVSSTNEAQKPKPLNTEIYPITKLLGRSAGVMLADLLPENTLTV
jgi:hypothetical protein